VSLTVNNKIKISYTAEKQRVSRELHTRVFLKPCPHCRRKVRLSPKNRIKRRLSPKTARKRRQSPNSATVALFCDSRRFRRQIVAEISDYSRQCGQAFTLHYKAVTIVSLTTLFAELSSPCPQLALCQPQQRLHRVR